MADQAVVVVAPVDGIPSGTLSIRLRRLVAGFVAQYELLSPPPFGEVFKGDDLAVRASYRAGDVVYCVPDESQGGSDNGQIAVFLADVPEARPAYPVIGRANAGDVLRTVDPQTWRREAGAEVVEGSPVIELSLAR